MTQPCWVRPSRGYEAGGKCGLFLPEFAEGRGRLILLFPDEHSSNETRFHFEEFVLAHASRRAVDGTVELVRFFVCSDCGVKESVN